MESELLKLKTGIFKLQNTDIVKTYNVKQIENLSKEKINKFDFNNDETLMKNVEGIY
jgi:hypothetical protein